MTERHEGPTAAGRGHLRAAHADRDRVVATLKAAFVQGRLNKDELDTRVGQALASRTYAELATLTADLPAGIADLPAGIADLPAGIADLPAGLTYVPAAPVATGTASTQPARTPRQTMARAAYRSAICLLLTVALVEGAFLVGFGGFLVLAIYTFMAFTGFLGYGVSDALQERRARRRLPGPA